MKLEAYETGVTKQIFPSGQSILRFGNGDVKTFFVDGTETYLFAESRILVTRFKNGDVLEEFPDGQTVRKSLDGTVLVRFPDGLTKKSRNGDEEITYPDGRVEKRRTVLV